jgi:signal transduction histidine kinase
MQLPSLGSLNDQQRALLSQGLLRSNELALLLNDLWAITQIALQPTDQYEAVRLPTLIEAAIAMQQYEFDRRGQQLVSLIGDQLACVFGDQELLGRALLALLDNAAKYTPSGAQVTVSLIQEYDYVQVAVQNTNVSLLPDELEHIFDPCYRAPSTAHLGITGRGLGLSIARAVVERHGGQIWALNPDGESTMVVFRMPCEMIGPL